MLIKMHTILEHSIQIFALNVAGNNRWKSNKVQNQKEHKLNCMIKLAVWKKSLSNLMTADNIPFILYAEFFATS